MNGIDIRLAERDVKRAVRSLERVPPRIGRSALRKGVFKAGSDTLKDARKTAPRGRTGQFRRSLAKKDIRNARQGVYTSIVGQKKKLTNTARQAARIARNSKRVSRGLSGQGFRPSIAWIEKGTKAHIIRPRRKRLLHWIIGKNRVVLRNMRHAKRVRHTGHAGTGFLERTEKQGRAKRLRIVAQTIRSEVRRLRRS